MKRLHVSLAVSDLDRSIAFYAELFSTQPSVRKDDYAKWQLDDPRVNFSITSRGRPSGFDHLGIEAEDTGELGEVMGRLDAAEGDVLDRGLTTCCYARSDEAWIRDPDGVTWEAFHTTHALETFGVPAKLSAPAASEKSEEKACCANEGAA